MQLERFDIKNPIAAIKIKKSEEKKKRQQVVTIAKALRSAFGLHTTTGKGRADSNAAAEMYAEMDGGGGHGPGGGGVGMAQLPMVPPQQQQQHRQQSAASPAQHPQGGTNNNGGDGSGRMPLPEMANGAPSPSPVKEKKVSKWRKSIRRKPKTPSNGDTNQ